MYSGEILYLFKKLKTIVIASTLLLMSLQRVHAKQCIDVIDPGALGYSLTSEVPKAVVYRGLDQLKVALLVFKSDAQAIKHFTQNLSQNLTLNKTYKYLELGVAYGPAWRQKGFDANKIVRFTMYTQSGQHKHLAEKAMAIFGERVEYIESGLLGAKKLKDSKTIYYFKGLNHEHYKSDWGRELLSDATVTWHRLK